MTQAAVTHRFAAVAEQYESHAVAQQWAARDLLKFTRLERPRAILEPGCGTGLYTRMLRVAFPDAAVLGVDICPQMLRVARRRTDCAAVEFALADAEGPLPGCYDLITSNATFQWFERLPQTLRRYADMLNEDGAVTFSFFGPETYCELNTALGELTGRSDGVAAARFANLTSLGEIMNRTFSRTRVEEKRYERSFASVWELLRNIKYTGTRGRPGEAFMFWTPSLIHELHEAYPCADERIKASYQVYLCEGRR